MNSHDGVTVLEVSGEGCANCFSLLPVLKQITSERGILLEHLEVNERNAERVRALEIERVPTVILFKDGKQIARCTGYQPQEILEVWIDAKIEQYER